MTEKNDAEIEAVTFTIKPYGGDGGAVALQQLGFGLQPFILIEPDQNSDEPDSVLALTVHLSQLDVEAAEFFVSNLAEALQQHIGGDDE